MRSPTSQQRRTGALAFWFGAIGGAIAWVVHLAVVWGVTETTCLSGHSNIAGTPLRTVNTLGVAIPGLVALAALAVSFRAWKKTDPDRVDTADRPRQRAHFVTGIGLYANLLFVAIIAFDGVALLVFPPCLT